MSDDFDTLLNGMSETIRKRNLKHEMPPVASAPDVKVNEVENDTPEAAKGNSARRHTRTAKGSQPKGTMNGLEAAYAAELELRKQAGEIVTWEYEKVTLKLAPRTTYTPDFFVIHADMTLEYVELKGFERDDAAAKFKIAAAQFPYFRFLMLKKKAGRFEIMRDSRA